MHHHPLLQYVRAVIAAEVNRIDPTTVPLSAAAAASLPEHYGGVFVTLHTRGRLRGCIGRLDTSTPFREALRQAALSAAFHDSRFPPVSADELDAITLSISVLTAPTPWCGIQDLVIGRHGVLVEGRGRRGVFLPQVATDHRMDAESFVSRCCDEKAGLPASAWRDGQAAVKLFEVQVFDEASTGD